MSFATAAFDAIGVSNQITVADADALPIALAIARAEVAVLDDACSRFRDDSELVRLNSAGSATVSPLLLEAIEVALEAAQVTDGLVDPTIGSAMRTLGYDRDFAVLVQAGAEPVFDLRPASGWQSVTVDHDRSIVRLRPGTELDLGATAKALAADWIADAIHLDTGSPVLVSLGGDIAVAGTPPQDGWPVLVTDDSRNRAGAGQVVAIETGGLATSSTTVRRWLAGRTEMHHIVDPRTGLPATETWRTVSVAAPSCLQANVAATAAIVLGPFAPSWLGSRSLAARLVRSDGTVVAIGDWPVEGVAA
jgi:thiamine biosynthesis lipoprotein